MDTTQVYIALRSEIVSNHVLMHWFTMTVALSVIVGTVLIERLGRTILSIILPLLSLAWAASTLRFDFFIHRQAAYLRFVETQTQTQLEEARAGDSDYYLQRDTLDGLEHRGADPTLIRLLRGAMRKTGEIEIEWRNDPPEAKRMSKSNK